jgi:predicted RNase H-like HicB family nuclease
MPVTHYPAIIDRSASGFGVSFPDFPGVIAAGDTPSEAAVNGEKALALHVQGLGKVALPAPSDIAAIEPVEGADDVARILVRVDTPGKVARVLISIDEGLLAQIDRADSNRSRFLADAAREKLVAG